MFIILYPSEMSTLGTVKYSVTQIRQFFQTKTSFYIIFWHFSTILAVLTAYKGDNTENQLK